MVRDEMTPAPTADSQSGGGRQEPPARPQAAFGSSEQASPEEQAQYEQFVGRAMSMTYSDEMLPRVLTMLKGNGDPVEGLAQTAAMVTARVASAAEKAGEQLSGDVVLEAGKEVLEDLANLATKAGIHDFENDPDSLEGAFFRGLDVFRGMLQGAGEIDLASAQQDMQQLQEMDRSGELERMLRGLSSGGVRDSGNSMAGGLAGAMEAAR